MIRLQDMTPEVYYKRSRDFQFIGRLYDLILNYTKTNADQLYNIPLSDNSDEKLIDLMTMTLGFKSKHNYNIKQLTALCSAFAEVIRQKGSITAIETACRVLLHSEGIEMLPDVQQNGIGEDYYNIDIYIDENLSDINLLKDLLNYILPAGMTYNIYKASNVTIDPVSTEIAYNSDNVVIHHETDKVTSVVVDARDITDTELPSTQEGYTINTSVIVPNATNITTKKATRRRTNTKKTEAQNEQ